MEKLIKNFTKHLRTSLDIWKNTNFKECDKDIYNVVICGVGGSGIGGTIASQLTAFNSLVPIVTNKGYELPMFVGKNTLVIVNSYSGNTEESLEMLKEAQEAGAEIACITSGGELERIAKESGYNHVIVPGGNPPRAAFGLTLPILYCVLEQYNIIPYYLPIFEDAIVMLDGENDIEQRADNISYGLLGKTPIIYSDTWTEGVSVRFRQQLNENAKVLCWHHALPEMNHNELVGWSEEHRDKIVVIFRNEDDNEKTKKRIEIMRGILDKYTGVVEIHSKGDNPLQRALYLIHFGDWISYFLAKKRGVDVMEVKVIDYLKKEMQK